MSIFALVDCNNFFVSCERSIDPTLEERPVVVLSNNDGCIISRSEEAKRLGIAMGAPYFKIRDALRQQGVKVFSSNFALYTAKSKQIMNILDSFSSTLENYSIDEAFLSLHGTPPAMLPALGLEMRETVRQKTGVPVSIGIASSKTLAKLANGIAKKSPRARGVLNLYQSPHLELALSRTPVGNVWGVGRRLAPRLENANIRTALDLSRADDQWVLKKFSVVLLRTVLELRGVSCLPIEQSISPRKSVMYSRSFGTLVETLSHMEAAVATFTARAAEKLREDGLTARHLGVYIRTSRHISPSERFSNEGNTWLPVHTDCTHELSRAALEITRRIFRDGYSYYKAAIYLADLASSSERQINLFDTRNVPRLQNLMKVLDDINATHGQGTLRYAAEGLTDEWRSRRTMLSEVTPAMLAAITADLKDTDQPRARVGFVHPTLG